MISFEKEKIKEYGAFFRRLPWIAGEWLFLCLLISTFIVLIFGAMIFYQYAIQAPRVESDTKPEVIEFRKDLFLDLMTKWEERQIRFNSALDKQYPDPF